MSHLMVSLITSFWRGGWNFVSRRVVILLIDEVSVTSYRDDTPEFEDFSFVATKTFVDKRLDVVS